MDTTQPQAPSKILLVDDDEMVRKAFARAVGAAGFEVDVAKDGWAAMKLAKRNQYAVVVLDYRMPGLNGLELKEELVSLLPDASYILLSGNVDLDLTLDAVNEHTVQHVLAKPWQITELVSTLNRASEVCWERLMARAVAAQAVANGRAQAAAVPKADQLAQLLGGEARALLAALRVRDAELARAGERVAALARSLGERMGLRGQELVEVELGGMLHKIGFLGIPDAILQKREALTPQEIATVQRHPLLGDQLLASLPELANVRRIVREHQERWDGQGYPARLSGPQICLGARIVAVAAAVDAMLSPRPYRPAATYEIVRDEVIKMCGTQFDPTVVQAFLELPLRAFTTLHDALAGAVRAA